MEKRKLGKYGAEVSAIGIGAMSFSNFYGPTNEQESHTILAEALDQGISHIDTANVYGAGQQLYRIIPQTIVKAKLGKKLNLGVS